MGEYFTGSELAQLSGLVAARTGLYFPKARWRDLEQGIVSAASASGFSDAHTYGQWLLSTSPTQGQIDALATYLTIGETYFFRERPTFDALREYVLLDLVTARRSSTRQLRFWSAGCCTGEEAYSCAILLQQMIPDWKKWKLTILATDINPGFLHKAAEGIYSEWSFRNVPPNIKQHYFTPVAPGRFAIKPSVQQMVQFARFNLVQNSYPPSFHHSTNSPRASTPGAMDIIFCRNVLMYFAPDQARKVVRNLYNSLAEGGWLIVGLGEASHALFSEFDAVQFGDAIFYQKRAVRRSKPSAENRLSFRPIRSLGSISSYVTERNATTSDVTAPLNATTYTQGHSANNEAQRHGDAAGEPQHADSLLAVARSCANEGRLDEALVWCERSIAVDQLNLRAYYLYATIQEALGSIDEAVRALRRVLYLRPDFVLAHFGLGYLTRQQGKSDESGKHFAHTLELLRAHQQHEALPESDGLTAGQLMEMLRSVSAGDPRQQN